MWSCRLLGEKNTLHKSMKGKYYLLFITFGYLLRKLARRLVLSLLSKVVVSVKMQIREARQGPTAWEKRRKWKPWESRGRGET